MVESLFSSYRANKPSFSVQKTVEDLEAFVCLSFPKCVLIGNKSKQIFMMRCPSYMMGGGLMSLMFSLMVVMFSLCAFPLVDGEETNYIRRRLAVEHVETHVPIRSTKRVEGAMIIDEKKYREGSVKSPARHKLQHAKDFSAALFGNATLDHYLVPPAGKDYRRDEDPSAFRVREWPAVFTLNCPDVKVP